MDFLEIGIIVVLVIAVFAILVYLMRYSNRRLVGMIQELEQRLSIQEKVSASNSRKLHLKHHETEARHAGSMETGKKTIKITAKNTRHNH